MKEGTSERTQSDYEYVLQRNELRNVLKPIDVMVKKLYSFFVLDHASSVTCAVGPMMLSPSLTDDFMVAVRP